MKNISVRLIDKSDYSICQQIVKNQQLIWDIPVAEAMPFWKLMTLQSTGGLLIGAFDNAQNIGHAMLTPAVDPVAKELYLYLDMVGVLPEYRNLGLAEKMLQLAKEQVMRQHITSIQWTFDPLETANANVYIRKLGAKAVRFYPDYYGSTVDGADASVTDRFWVKWDFESKIKTHELPATIIQLNDDSIEHGETTIAIELPDDFSELKKHSPAKAAEIRCASKVLFAHLYEKVYFITGFVRLKWKNYYIAIKQSSA